MAKHTLEDYATAIQQLDGLRAVFISLDREAAALERKNDESDAFDYRALESAMIDTTQSVNDVVRAFDLSVDFSNWPQQSDAAKAFF